MIDPSTNDFRSSFLVQLMDKLGGPLVCALLSQGGGVSSSGEDTRDAQTIASLLMETVKVSISLSQAMNLRPDDGNPDAIRLGLACVGASLIGEVYKEEGRIPAEGDQRRIVKALESVLAFSGNFAPSPEHGARLSSLSTLSGGMPFFDEAQSNVFVLHALAPVVSAVVDFSFGQQESLLVQDIAARLGQKVKDLHHAMAPNAREEDSKTARMVLLQLVGRLYAAAHRAETDRLRALEDRDSETASIENVWGAFEKQIAVLDVLASTLGSAVAAERQEKASGEGAGGGVKPSPAAEEKILVNQPVTSSPVPSSVPPSSSIRPGSPMSFFKKGG